MPNPSLRPLGDKRSILIDDNGAPVLVELKARAATSAPAGTRYKAALAVPVSETQMVAMPFAEAGGGFTVEFRMEMN